MQQHIDAKEQGNRAERAQTPPTDEEILAARGFTGDEIVSLLWLRQWYQTGGSDRVELLCLWEGIKQAVLSL